MRPELESKASAIHAIARKHGVASLNVFGSQAAGTATENSDLDLLVRLEPGRDLLDLIEFKLEVEAMLGCRVDVVTENALSPYFREQVLQDIRPL